MQSSVYLYQNDQIAVKPLGEKELKGNYPNWFCDLDVCRHNRHGVFSMSFAQVKSFVESLSGDRSQIVWAVYHLADYVHIGNVSLQNINLIDRTAEIAFVFGEKNYWGQGFAFQGAQWLLKHGFDKLNLNRISCGTASSNTAMQRLAEKLGMEKEGVRRQALFLNGAYEDIVEFGVLRSEWEN